MSNKKKAKEIYKLVLIDVNGWDTKDAAEAVENMDGYDEFYEKILSILNKQ